MITVFGAARETQITPAVGAAGPAGTYVNWSQRAGAYLLDVIPIIVIEFIGRAFGHVLILLLAYLVALALTVYNRW